MKGMYVSKNYTVRFTKDGVTKQTYHHREDYALRQGRGKAAQGYTVKVFDLTTCIATF